MTEPMPEIPYGPPDYMGAETCTECWEPFTPGFVDRWFHRRKWGHNPTPLHPTPTAPDLHARNVEGARRYRGDSPASKDPGVR
jgi:hypothetical protein